VPLCNATLTVNPPGTAGDGYSYLCSQWDFTLNDIDAISDQGPNHGLKWLLDIRNLTTFDWTLHPDIEDPTSDWYTRQCGNWAPAPGSTCPTPSGTGYISGAAYRDGVTRHEAGDQNSHYRNYVTAQDDPANNIKIGAEDLFGLPTQSTSDFVAFVNGFLMLRSNAIVAATADEPCHQQCSSDCALFNGFLNLPPYQSCP